MKTLDKLTFEEVKRVIPDREAIKKLKKDEPLFKIVSNDLRSIEIDELVDMEIALRRCERTGFFRN